MQKEKGLKDYSPRDGDLIVRRISEQRWEVCKWVGYHDGGWEEQRPMSTDELNKRVRIPSNEYLGQNQDWDYYRPR